MLSSRAMDLTDADLAALIIRRVMPVDLRATAELLVSELKQRGRELDPAAVRNAVQATLEDAQGVLVIGAYHENQPGFAHGKMVGVLIMTVTMSIEHAGEVGWIENLYVRADYRRRGLAERMLRQVLTFAETRGLRALDLEVGDSDGHDPEAAAHLYTKHGFRKIPSARLRRDFTRA
ncbi:MAG: GNAT family N-acetyltransferase [Myxococcales bacterium]|nr:GNAT family N-acetyltransferase [Myxococcales bacterium]